MFRPNCRAILRLMFEQLECYILYYILAHRIILFFFIISKFKSHSSNKSLTYTCPDQGQSKHFTIVTKIRILEIFLSICPLKSVHGTVLYFHYLPLRHDCIVTRCDV